MPLSKTEEAQRSMTLFSTYKRERQEWLNDRIREQKFAYGEQWTDKEAAGLKARGQVDYVINRTWPHIKRLRSMLTSRTPEAQIVPAGESPPELISLLNQLLKYILKESYWGVQFRRVVNSMIMKSLGWVWVHVDPFASEGRGDIKATYLNITDVYVPPDASDIFFDDARAILISRVIPVKDAKDLYPDVSEKEWQRVQFPGNVEQTEHQTSDQVAEEGRTEPIGKQPFAGADETMNVRIIHRFEKKRVKVTRIIDNVSGQDREVEGEVEKVEIHETKATFLKTQVRMVTSAGEDVYVQEEVLPIEHWPVIPFPFEEVENPYPPGAVTQFEGVQKLINKYFALILLNVQLAGSPKWMFEEGSIDESVWQENAALPGALLPYKRGTQPPTPIQGAAISQGMFALLQELKDEFSFETGTFEFHQGAQDRSKMPPTYSQTLAAQEQSVQRMGPMVANVDAGLQRMYEVILQMVPSVYSEFRLLPIIDEDSGVLQTIPINAPDEKSPESGLLDVLTDVTKFKAYVHVRTGSTVEPSRVAYLTLMQQMAAQNPIFMKYMVSFMDVPFRSQMMQEMDENAQLRQMADDYEGQVKQLQDFIDSLDRSLVEKDRKVELAQFRATLVKQAADHKIALAEIRAREKRATQTREE